MLLNYLGGDRHMEVLMILPKSKEVVILGSRVFVMLICLSGNAALKFVVGVRTLQRPV